MNISKGTDDFLYLTEESLKLYFDVLLYYLVNVLQLKPLKFEFETV